MTYTIQAGREPALSLEELKHVFGVTGGDVTVVGNVFIIKGSAPGSALFSKLGGSIKMGEFLAEFTRKEFDTRPIPLLAQCIMQSEIDDFSGAFAINFFGDVPIGLLKKKRQMGIALKKTLKQQISHARFVESKEPVTSSVTVKRNKLLRGADLWLIFKRQTVFAYRTIAVQDYRAFAERDYGRPKSDAQSGMLPPKLARMMLNIAGVTDSSCLYDPFVGSGTVLVEAAQLGVRNFLGSDIEPRAVEYTKQNVSWMSEQLKEPLISTLFVSDVALISLPDVEKATHVVGELDLGAPLRVNANQNDARIYAQHAGSLTEKTLALVAKLPHLVSCVLAIPFWIHADGSLTITSFTAPRGISFLPVDQFIHNLFPKESTDRGGFLYMREDQFVGREIVVFVK